MKRLDFNHRRETKGLLGRLGELAGEFGTSAYLIGGSVRDLLLNLPAEDLDIMVEGSAIDFVEALRDSWPTVFPELLPPSKINKFPRYGTAKLEFSQEFLPGRKILDFSSARSETYSHPGARPDVKPGDLRSDLFRRDFSINAMAIALAPENFGELFDYFSGEQDLSDRLIRVLHEKSFVDDPIRLLRAVRFMVRFSFNFEQRTEELFCQAVKENYLENVTKDRRQAELKKAQKEAKAAEILAAADKLGILTQLQAGAG